MTKQHLLSESAFADDRLTICCKNQEAALQTLRESYGAGYGKPLPGSASDIRGQKYQKGVTKEVIDLCRMIYNHVSGLSVKMTSWEI